MKAPRAWRCATLTSAVLLPLVLATLDAPMRTMRTTAGGAATVVAGWDSSAVPGRSPGESGAFTGLDAYGVVGRRDRGGDGYELRVLGRGVLYPTLDEGATLDGRAGASWVSAARIHARARFALTVGADVGSSRATRGTDGIGAPIDALSARRIDVGARVTASFLHDLSPTWSLTQAISFGIGATLRDRLVSGAEREAGLDAFVLGLRSTLAHAISARATWDGSVSVDRTRLLYVVDTRSATLREASPMDLTALGANVGLSLRTSGSTTAFARAGVVLTSARRSTPGGQDPSTAPVPTLTLGLLRRDGDATLSATAGFSYTLVDPRVGAGAGLTADLRWQGSPTRHARGLTVLLAGYATRSTILGGPNDGTAFLASSLSGQLRLALARWIGVVGGADLRASRLESGDLFTRAIVFVGVSSGWWSDAGTPPIGTLASPAPP